MTIIKSSTFKIFSVLLFFVSGLEAQELHYPLSFKKALKKGTRTETGKPGTAYWQNGADYELNITFDPATRLLTGNANIVYYNNSPDTLDKIVFRNYPDYYKKDALRDFWIAAEDEGEGLKVDSFFIDGSNAAKAITRDETLMDIKTMVLPKTAVKLKIKWHYILNKGSHVRTGAIDESTFFIAYCYPRIAVYDDLEGWDRTQYHGTLEPYTDFGNFNLNVTVPENFMVWSTGELLNAKEVLHASIYNKLNDAIKGKFQDIITVDEIRNKKVTAPNIWNTFRFSAINVPDVAFALSDHYKWNGGSIKSNDGRKKIFISSAYNPEHKNYEEITSFAKKTVELMGSVMPAVEYPYPHITIIDGLDQMEFPMIVNDNPIEDRHEAIELTVHEIYHTLLPFYTGCNQSRYAWMDEGWATMSEWIISPMIDSTIVNLFGKDRVLKSMGTEYDVPLIFPSTEWHRCYSMNAYAKPAYALLYLREMLGKESFNKCFSYFIETWKGRHPSPWDFFYCFNYASGKDLNWFWQSWFYEPGEMDIAIESAKLNGKKIDIAVRIKGNKPVPLYISLLNNKGEVVSKVIQSPEIWKSSNGRAVVAINDHAGASTLEIKNIYVPDIDESDNKIVILR